MKQIKLTQGKVALVDDTWYPKLKLFKWHAHYRHGNWYAVRSVRRPDGTRTKEMMHRVILGLTDPRIEGDHRDGDGLNNQGYNLRIATSVQNNRNRGVRKDSITGVCGVWFDKDKRKYRAFIRVKGKNKYLGYFTNLEEAAAVRRAAELKYYGEFSAILSRGEALAQAA